MRKLFLSAVLVFLLSATAAPLAAADNVATLRISSLDAVLADAERISAMTGRAMTRKDLLQSSLGTVGIGDAAWIDGTRPIVISLPADGMMNMGWVGAFPVKDAKTALAALEARLGPPEVDGELRSFVTAVGTTIQVRVVETYLVVGQAPAAVRGADLKRLLDVGALPPGNVALDLDLLPLTAMAQFGMAAARQGVEDGLELDEADAAGREAAMGMYDLYVGMVNDVLLNTRRLQLSFEVGSEYFKVHKWLLPRADSTLAGLLKAQKSGFPDFARRMSAESAVAVLIGGMDLSDQFRVALKEFSASYAKLMGSMGESMPGEEGERLRALMGPWMKTADKWIDCARGDMAATYEFTSAGGFRVVQIGGLTDREKCGELLDDVATLLAEMPEMPDGRSLAVVKKQALVYSGVEATRMEFDLFGDALDSDAEELEFMERMLGEEGYVYYMGLKDDLLLATAGAGAEQAFKDAVDEMSLKKKHGGITPKQFEPMKADAGFFFAVDLAKVLHEVAKFDPDDEDLGELDALAEQAGRWVFGTHLNPDALRIELAMPLSALQLFAALDDDEGQGDDDHEYDDDDPQQHEVESGGD